MLDDTSGRTSLPVTAELIPEWWIKIGADDWRQVSSCRSENGVVYYGITPSRLGVAERVRAQRLSEAVAAGRALQTALGKLDDSDKGRCHANVAILKRRNQAREQRNHNWIERQ